jgi:hypothetical protein
VTPRHYKMSQPSETDKALVNFAVKPDGTAVFRSARQGTLDVAGGTAAAVRRLAAGTAGPWRAGSADGVPGPPLKRGGAFGGPPAAAAAGPGTREATGLVSDVRVYPAEAEGAVYLQPEGGGVVRVTADPLPPVPYAAIAAVPPDRGYVEEVAKLLEGHSPDLTALADVAAQLCYALAEREPLPLPPRAGEWYRGPGETFYRVTGADGEKVVGVPAGGGRAVRLDPGALEGPTAEPMYWDYLQAFDYAVRVRDAVRDAQRYPDEDAADLWKELEGKLGPELAARLRSNLGTIPLSVYGGEEGAHFLESKDPEAWRAAFVAQGQAPPEASWEALEAVFPRLPGAEQLLGPESRDSARAALVRALRQWEGRRVPWRVQGVAYPPNLAKPWYPPPQIYPNAAIPVLQGAASLAWSEAQVTLAMDALSKAVAGLYSGIEAQVRYPGIRSGKTPLRHLYPSMPIRPHPFQRDYLAQLGPHLRRSIRAGAPKNRRPVYFGSLDQDSLGARLGLPDKMVAESPEATDPSGPEKWKWWRLADAVVRAGARAWNKNVERTAAGQALMAAGVLDGDDPGAQDEGEGMTAAGLEIQLSQARDAALSLANKADRAAARADEGKMRLEDAEGAEGAGVEAVVEAAALREDLAAFGAEAAEARREAAEAAIRLSKVRAALAEAGAREDADAAKLKLKRRLPLIAALQLGRDQDAAVQAAKVGLEPDDHAKQFLQAFLGDPAAVGAMVEIWGWVARGPDSPDHNRVAARASGEDGGRNGEGAPFPPSLGDPDAWDLQVEVQIGESGVRLDRNGVARYYAFYAAGLLRGADDKGALDGPILIDRADMVPGSGKTTIAKMAAAYCHQFRSIHGRSLAYSPEIAYAANKEVLRRQLYDDTAGLGSAMHVSLVEHGRVVASNFRMAGGAEPGVKCRTRDLIICDPAFLVFYTQCKKTQGIGTGGEDGGDVYYGNPHAIPFMDEFASEIGDARLMEEMAEVRDGGDILRLLAKWFPDASLLSNAPALFSAVGASVVPEGMIADAIRLSQENRQVSFTPSREGKIYVPAQTFTYAGDQRNFWELCPQDSLSHLIRGLRAPLYKRLVGQRFASKLRDELNELHARLVRTGEDEDLRERLDALMPYVHYDPGRFTGNDLANYSVGLLYFVWATAARYVKADPGLRAMCSDAPAILPESEYLPHFPPKAPWPRAQYASDLLCARAEVKRGEPRLYGLLGVGKEGPQAPGTCISKAAERLGKYALDPAERGKRWAAANGLPAAEGGRMAARLRRDPEGAQREARVAARAATGRSGSPPKGLEDVGRMPTGTTLILDTRPLDFAMDMVARLKNVPRSSVEEEAEEEGGRAKLIYEASHMEREQRMRALEREGARGTTTTTATRVQAEVTDGDGEQLRMGAERGVMQKRAGMGEADLAKMAQGITTKSSVNPWTLGPYIPKTLGSRLVETMSNKEFYLLSYKILCMPEAENTGVSLSEVYSHVPALGVQYLIGNARIAYGINVKGAEEAIVTPRAAATLSPETLLQFGSRVGREGQSDDALIYTDELALYRIMDACMHTYNSTLACAVVSYLETQKAPDLAAAVRQEGGDEHAALAAIIGRAITEKGAGGVSDVVELPVIIRAAAQHVTDPHGLAPGPGEKNRGDYSEMGGDPLQDLCAGLRAIMRAVVDSREQTTFTFLARLMSTKMTGAEGSQKLSEALRLNMRESYRMEMGAQAAAAATATGGGADVNEGAEARARVGGRASEPTGARGRRRPDTEGAKVWGVEAAAQRRSRELPGGGVRTRDLSGIEGGF